MGAATMDCCGRMRPIAPWSRRFGRIRRPKQNDPGRIAEVAKPLWRGLHIGFVARVGLLCRIGLVGVTTAAAAEEEGSHKGRHHHHQQTKL